MKQPRLCCGGDAVPCSEQVPGRGVVLPGSCVLGPWRRNKADEGVVPILEPAVPACSASLLPRRLAATLPFCLAPLPRCCLVIPVCEPLRFSGARAVGQKNKRMTPSARGREGENDPLQLPLGEGERSRGCARRGRGNGTSDRPSPDDTIRRAWWHVWAVPDRFLAPKRRPRTMGV